MNSVKLKNSGVRIKPGNINRERLKELLNYNTHTGDFIWIKRTSNRVNVGSVAGRDNKNGYRRIKIDGKNYYAHRLAWLYMYGEFPKDVIDHIDGNGMNNAIENLRSGTMAQNCQNMALKINNTSGYHGVSWNKKYNKWEAYIWKNYKKKFLGFFDKAEDAYAKYLKAKKNIHTFNPVPRDIVERL